MDTKQKERKYILPTYARFDIELVKGENATVWDVNEKRYVDFTSGIGVVSVGHANRRLAEAICTQATQMIHISNLFYIPKQVEAAEKIVTTSGYDMACFFANSGAEANEGAIKIARKYGEEEGEVKRYKIITLKHSFHGRTITTVKATGQEKMHNYFGPFPDGFVYAEDIDEIESLIDDHTVAVMIELVQGEGGVEPLDKQKVQSLAATLRKKDVLLIVDEVQTGVYRTGTFLASRYYGIEPDIITLAKGLGGGVPVGVVMTSKKDVFSAGDHGSTFGGNYLSSAAVCAVMDILQEEYTSGKLQKTTTYFNEKLTQLFHAYPSVFVKRVGIGMMCGLRCRDAETLNDIVALAQEEGVLVLKAGRDTLRLLPPLTISKKEIDEGFDALTRALERI